MKNPKKLTRIQKVFLSDQKMNADDYLLERQDAESYTFYNIKTGNLLILRR